MVETLWTSSEENIYDVLLQDTGVLFSTDANGRMQPPVAHNWNPQGYGGNTMHRVAVLVG